MTKKRGLGKGLEALIPTAVGQWDSNEEKGRPGIEQAPVEKIAPNPHQPRAPIDENELTELAASIVEHGLIQPVIVTRVGDQYQLIAGERRWRAARQAGLDTIPVIVKEATRREMLELALVENIQRADLNPLEEATAYRQLMDEFGLTQDQVADRVGKSRPAVGNTVRLLNLPSVVQAAILEKRITEGHGRALLSLPTTEAQEAVLKTILKQKLNVRQTEELVRRLIGQGPIARSRPMAPEIKEIQDRLRRRLGTKVRIRHGRDGGQIVIHYYSDEELQALLEHFGGE